MDKLIYDSTSFKSCGAFGQGNFANLMLGQQKGIEKMDKLRQQQAKKGQAFELPLLDLDTIDHQPTHHLQQHIAKVETNGEQDKAQVLRKTKDNIDRLIAECQKRNLWN